MYDLIDRPIRDLPRFERHVLDRTRRWTHAFSVAGVDAAVGHDEAFDAVMQALHEGSRADIVLQRPCFATVGEAEAVILSLWRLARAGRHAAARTLAEALVDRTCAEPLLNGIARTLAKA